MDLEQTAVENENLEVPADDALEDSLEVTDESEEETLESITEEGEKPEEQPQQEEASEPGWIKRRVNKAVEKAVAETERRMQAEFDRQIAPLREKMLNDEARELVRQGEFKSLERAKEYLQLKQGVPTQAAQQEPEKQAQPRNKQGQYAPKEDAGTSARIDMLAYQADKLKAQRGIDVIAEFNRNEEIKKAVISGEMDFYDVAEQMAQTKTRKPPAPMRSPNGASGINPNAIESMSDEQFARLEKRIREGARISLK